MKQDLINLYKLGLMMLSIKIKQLLLCIVNKLLRQICYLSLFYRLYKNIVYNVTKFTLSPYLFGLFSFQLLTN